MVLDGQMRTMSVTAQESALQLLRGASLQPTFVSPCSGGLTHPDKTMPHVWCFDLAYEKINSSDRFLQFVLQQYAEEPPPHEAKIVRAPGGKPILLPQSGEPTLSFSVAHSGLFFCVVVSSASSVGIDVELMRCVEGANKIAGRWFLTEEVLALRRLPERHQEAGFLKLWVAKEALAKRHGAGLRVLSASNDKLAIVPPYLAGTLSLIECGEALMVALASTSPMQGWVKYTPPAGVVL